MKVLTQNGFQHVFTENDRVLIMSTSGHALFVHSSMLKIGDYIAQKRSDCVWKNEDPLLLFDIYIQQWGKSRRIFRKRVKQSR